ncbi:hypothetical protein FRC03_005388 [Tulasnella sp. 419]|nr:hypothetical protein FRC03_005388 [Tulasnella sp. 419]
MNDRDEAGSKGRFFRFRAHSLRSQNVSRSVSTFFNNSVDIHDGTYRDRKGTVDAKSNLHSPITPTDITRSRAEMWGTLHRNLEFNARDTVDEPIMMSTTRSHVSNVPVASDVPVPGSA